MTKRASHTGGLQISETAKARLKKRYRAEKRFRFFGIAAICCGALALLTLLTTVFSSGTSAFFRTELSVDVEMSSESLGIDLPLTEEALQSGKYKKALRTSFYAQFPGVSQRRDKRALAKMLSAGAALQLQAWLSENPDKFGETASVWVLAASDIDQIHKGNAPRDIEEKRRKVTDQQLAWYDTLVEQGRVRTTFNWAFFSNGDSRSPELAGIGSAIMGSFYALLVCFLLSFPLGVAAAIYLEEFAPKNRLTDIIEANINNLAAVPSIIFGLMGLAIILNVFGLPRGTPLVGGVVLSLMTLPTIIIACRASIKAVPPSIRQAALAMGASPVQTVLHHVLPLAMPGTLTGTIVGLAQALGETAPLLMIGMVAFVVSVPGSPLDPSAALPVQVYLWAESAERGFVEKTAAAIMVILAFLVVMNLIAVILRARFERKW
ncbi:MAG: phosphate ABC transporter permease PstA [Pseudomonadota bacterium]